MSIPTWRPEKPDLSQTTYAWRSGDGNDYGRRLFGCARAVNQRHVEPLLLLLGVTPDLLGRIPTAVEGERLRVRLGSGEAALGLVLLFLFLKLRGIRGGRARSSERTGLSDLPVTVPGGARVRRSSDGDGPTFAPACGL